VLTHPQRVGQAIIEAIRDADLDAGLSTSKATRHVDLIRATCDRYEAEHPEAASDAPDPSDHAARRERMERDWAALTEAKQVLFIRRHIDEDAWAALTSGVS
jgi:hypothetical protein